MPSLTIRVTADTSSAEGKLDRLATRTGGLREGLASMQGPALGALAAIGGLATAAGKAAVDAEQAAGGIATVFGAYAAEAQANAAAAAQSVGLSSTAYSEFAATLGSQLKNAGTPMEELAGQTDQLIKLGADLAATFGGSTADAVAAVSSLMRGERDPIERYGVAFNEADVQAQKLALGLGGLSGEADRQATSAATLALLTQQTADAQGAFAREADTAAGALARGQAGMSDAAAELGAVLIPAIAAAGLALADFARWVQDNQSLVIGLAVAVGVIAAAIVGYNTVMAIVPVVQAAATAAQWLLNAAMAANPVGLLVLAIVALIAIIIALVANWDRVKAVALQVWSSISAAASQAASWVMARVSGALGSVEGYFRNLGARAASVWAEISSAAAAVGATVSAVWSAAVSAVVGAVTGLQARVSAAWATISGGVQAVAATVRGGLTSAWEAVSAAVSGFVGRITGGISSAIGSVQSLISWVGSLTSRLGSVQGLISTVSGILASGAPTLTAGWVPQPMLTLAAASLTGPGLLIPTRAGQTPPPAAVVINISGALDPQAVARQIRRMLSDIDRIDGREPVGGVA